MHMKTVLHPGSVLIAPRPHQASRRSTLCQTAAIDPETAIKIYNFSRLPSLLEFATFS